MSCMISDPAQLRSICVCSPYPVLAQSSHPADLVLCTCLFSHDAFHCTIGVRVLSARLLQLRPVACIRNMPYLSRFLVGCCKSQHATKLPTRLRPPTLVWHCCRHSLAKVYGCLQDELQINEQLTSVQAISKHLLQLMEEQDAQHSGTIPLAQLVTSLQALSQACIGLNNITLACVIGHACSSGSEDVKYDVWAPAAAAMLYSMLNPAAASVRLAAAEEFKGRGESEKKRSANLQALQASLLHTAALMASTYGLCTYLEHNNLAILLHTHPMCLVNPQSINSMAWRALQQCLLVLFVCCSCCVAAWQNKLSTTLILIRVVKKDTLSRALYHNAQSCMSHGLVRALSLISHDSAGGLFFTPTCLL